MKISVLVLGCLSLMATTMAAVRAPGVAVAAPGAVQAPPPATLSQDLEELSRLLPMKMIMKLIERYLLNDAEFQAVVRTLNSYDAFIVRMRFRTQPEVISFHSWVRSQLIQSGGSFELDESLELKLFRMSPYWANSVWGWQGFISEFMSYYPLELLQTHIDMKIAENGVFAQFWQRVKALQPVYERILGCPEAKRLISELQTQNVDTNQLDQIIRTVFDWTNAPVATAAEAPAVNPPAIGQVGPAQAAGQAVRTPILG